MTADATPSGHVAALVDLLDQLTGTGMVTELDTPELASLIDALARLRPLLTIASDVAQDELAARMPEPTMVVDGMVLERKHSSRWEPTDRDGIRRRVERWVHYDPETGEEFGAAAVVERAFLAMDVAFGRTRPLREALRDPGSGSDEDPLSDYGRWSSKNTVKVIRPGVIR